MFSRNLGSMVGKGIINFKILISPGCYLIARSTKTSLKGRWGSVFSKTLYPLNLHLCISDSIPMPIPCNVVHVQSQSHFDSIMPWGMWLQRTHGPTPGELWLLPRVCHSFPWAWNNPLVGTAWRGYHSGCGALRKDPPWNWQGVSSWKINWTMSFFFGARLPSQAKL